MVSLGYRRTRSPNYINYKSPTSNRPSTFKTIPPLSSFANYKPFSVSHVENISSDEAQIIDSDDDFSSIFGNSKSNGRSHRVTKKEKRQSRRKTRLIDSEKERCLAHGKRRCPDSHCNPIEVTGTRKKRARHKYDERKTSKERKYSSDSENELLGKREELKMALNIIAPSNKTINSSTLSHKLTAFQALADDRKSIAKHKKRKISRSPDRGISARRRTRSKENTSSKRLKTTEHGRRSRNKTESPIAIDKNNEINDIQVDEDERILLEEQQLRLIALKSAVLKKHEARKQKQQTSQLACQLIEQIGRPYSPTDSVVFVPDETGEKSNDCIDSDNNNMDISPISSPGNSCQAMDMDLASSNENSKSPVFSYEKPQSFAPFEQFIDWGAVAIPLPINAPFVEMDQNAAATALNQAFAMQPPYPLIFDQMQKEPLPAENSVAKSIPPDSTEQIVRASHVDNEEELRAQLIKQLRNTNSMNTNSSVVSSSKAIETTEKCVPTEHFNNVDDTLEEDCLRSLLLSSKGKKSNVIKESSNESQQTTTPPPKSDELRKPPDQAKCDDMPKLTLNLREALKRIKDNQQNKAAVKTSSTVTPVTTTTNVTDEIEAETCAIPELNKKESEMPEVCDRMDIQKPIDNSCPDRNKNELCISDEAASLVIPPSSSKPIIASSAFKTVKPLDKLPLQKVNVDKTKQTAKAVMNKPSGSAVVSVKTAKLNAAKMILTKAAVSADTNIPVSKPTAMSKPKPKIALKPKPVAATPLKPLKPQSTTSATVSNKTSLMLATAASIAATTTTATVSPMTVTNFNKMELARKSTGSPIITNWIPKPVKKLIISLNEDSSSENEEIDNESKYMGSSMKKAETDSSSQSNDSSNTFQLRLDQFLQTVRANTESTQDVKQQVLAPAANTTKTTENRTNNSTKMIQVCIQSCIYLFECKWFFFKKKNEIERFFYIFTFDRFHQKPNHQKQ